MGLRNGVNECQSKPVSRRVLSFHKPLKYAAANLGRETRPIILDHQFGIALARPEPNIDLAAGRKVYEFIFQQIAQRAIDKPEVGLDYDATLAGQFLPHDACRPWPAGRDGPIGSQPRKVHRHPFHWKGSGFGFGDIQRRVEQSRHAVQSFDGLRDRVSPLVAVFGR